MCYPEEHGKRRGVLKPIFPVRRASSRSPAATEKAVPAFPWKFTFPAHINLGLGSSCSAARQLYHCEFCFALFFFFKYMPLKWELKHLEVRIWSFEGRLNVRKMELSLHSFNISCFPSSFSCSTVSVQMNFHSLEKCSRVAVTMHHCAVYGPASFRSFEWTRQVNCRWYHPRNQGHNINW